MSFFTLFFRIFFLFVSIVTIAQELPPIVNFPSSSYNGESQNWAISQDIDGLIYVANNKGLLQYNGENWKLYDSENETILRSVKAIKKRIYTGTFMDFGYWEPNNKGELIYTSVVEQQNLKLIEDEQIWNILSHDDWVFFQSLNSIYIYNPLQESIKSINLPSLIFKSFLINNNDVYFQCLEKGLFKIFNGEAQLVSNIEFFKKQPLVNVFQSADSEDVALVLTQNNGFYKWNSKYNTLTKWNVLLENDLQNISVYNSIQLQNGDLVLGTISNGVLLLNKHGKLLYSINQERGLLNNTVLTTFEDRDNNIWLGLDNGISYINKTSPVSIYNDEKGMLGTVYTSIVYDENLYLGTNQGLFFKKIKDPNSEFQFVEGTKGQVWSLNLIGPDLFCGHNEGTFIVKNNDKIQNVSDIQGTWSVKPLVVEGETFLLQGNYDGMYVLKNQGKGWELSHKIKGFDISSRYFEVFDDTIFVNHEYKGIYILKIDEGFTEVKNLEIITELKGKNSSLIKYDNKPLYSYKKGVFTYDFASKSFKRDSVFSKLYDEEFYVTGKLIPNEKDGSLWSFNNKEFVCITPGKFSKNHEFKVVNMPNTLENSMSGFENLLNIKEDTYLFGNSSGYYLFDSSLKNVKEKKLILHKIEATDRANNTQLISLESEIELPNKLNFINFEFSVPFYDSFENVLYQYRLKGYLDGWSNWSKKSIVNFKNLSHGEYVFEVRAKVGNKVLDSTLNKEFEIRKVWYASNMAIIIYILLLAATFFFINNFYQSYYENQKEKTLANIKNELALKELESNKHLMELENQKLVQDIEGKNRELAISTMSLVRKNEFLNNIKKELLSKEDSGNVKDVIKVIDKNINNTDDWKFFQQAFDNADKHFLKKVKTKHPSLTPNDLKLCAYLRLNLSSKEIAPLLNISPRSVEVKRYRLRKKMELDHEMSLTNYILEI